MWLSTVEVHGFLLYRSWLRVFRTSADFLERKVAQGSGK